MKITPPFLFVSSNCYNELMKRFTGKSFIFPFLLVLVVFLLFFLNYSPNSWLSGWDTLNPEFNFLLNFKRIVNGVWRQEQGLGAIAGHSHMSELPRIILLWIVSLIFPLSFLRWFFVFLCLVAGPLGIYFLLKKTIFKDDSLSSSLSSFLGGLFYLLNLGTLQHFYVPFEMFTVQYALLPWLFLSAIKYLDKGGKKNLFLFVLVTFLSTPMAYAATLWYVYFGFFVIFLLLYRFQIKSGMTRSVILIALTVIINSYWLLPNLYYLKTAAGNVPYSKTNLLFSEKAFEDDTKYATPQSATIFKGFLFDWQKYNGNKFEMLMQPWINHLQNKFILPIGYLLFIFVLAGIFVSIFQKKKSLILTFLPGLLISLVFLTRDASVLRMLFDFLRSKVNIFKEGLRFPWTKFSLMAIFSSSLFFSFAVEKICKKLKKKYFVLIFTSGIALLFIIWMWPAFRGNIINKYLKVKIPQEYFETFSFFDKQKENERIGFFPNPTVFGWEYYNWGFEGAGFIWFGLKQPILVRDFDRWSSMNENYYWEVTYALYSKNLPLLESVLNKYQVTWIIIDRNLINPAWPNATYYEDVEKLISVSDRFDKAGDFGKIKIYRFEPKDKWDNFVSIMENLPVVNEYKWNNYDRGYLEYGNYVILSGSEGSRRDFSALPQNDVYYPFRSLFTGRRQEDLEFKVREEGDFFVFETEVPKELAGGELVAPEFFAEEIEEIVLNKTIKITKKQPQVFWQDNLLQVKVPKIHGYQSYDLVSSGDLLDKKAESCDNNSEGNIKSEITSDYSIKVESLDSKGCLSFNLPNLSHRIGYLLTTKTKNVAGKPFLFWIENLNIKKADMETYVPKDNEWQASYFIQPPMGEFGMGYGLHFDNVSIGREKSINELAGLTVNPISYRFLTGIKISQNSKLPPAMLRQAKRAGKTQNPALPAGRQNLNLKTIKVNKVGTAFYKIKLTGKVGDNEILVLSQSYDSGWIALQVQKPVPSGVEGFKVQSLKHVLINNWENGWNINDSLETIYLFYWPQLLEYLGFGLMLGGLGWIFLRKKPFV